MRLGVFLGGTGENQISDINAARRLLFDTGSRIPMRLGVLRVSWTLPSDPDTNAARRLQFEVDSDGV